MFRFETTTEKLPSYTFVQRFIIIIDEEFETLVPDLSIVPPARSTPLHITNRNKEMIIGICISTLSCNIFQYVEERKSELLQNVFYVCKTQVQWRECMKVTFELCDTYGKELTGNFIKAWKVFHFETTTEKRPSYIFV